jgi:hypothetical protein
MFIDDMHETGSTVAWVPHDADNCCLIVYTTAVDVCSILHALCPVLDQYIFHYCIML